MILHHRNFLLLFAFAALACTQGGPDPIEKDIPNHLRSTTFKAKTPRGEISFRCSVEDSLYFRDLAFVAGLWNESGQVFLRSETLDVTGDGGTELAINEIRPYSTHTAIRNTIRSTGTIIWQDSCIIDRTNYEGSDVLDSATISQNIGWFAFYEAMLRYTDFIMDSGAHLNTRPNILDMKRDSGFWKPELQKFKGRLVKRLDQYAIELYIWDPRTRTFVRYYST